MFRLTGSTRTSSIQWHNLLDLKTFSWCNLLTAEVFLRVHLKEDNVNCLKRLH